MSFQDVRARTAARKAAGADQTYPQHAGRARHTIAPDRARVPLSVREPCHHEGAILEHCHTCAGDLRSVRECDLYERATRAFVSARVRACEWCPAYAAPARAGGPACGVAIGSYRWPELIELQIRLIRATCGPVPVLVGSDDPGGAAALEAVCGAHPDVSLVVNATRIGHTGGDLAVYHRAVTWGAGRGLRVVAKLSQRMLLTDPYWLHAGADELLASGLPLATRGALGPLGGARYPLRTEAGLIDVAAWDRPEVLAAVAPGAYWGRRAGGFPAEVAVAELVRGTLGGAYWPWAALPADRQSPGAGGFLWRDSHRREDYDALAARFGVQLPPDFTVGGWERELAAGEYNYG